MDKTPQKDASLHDIVTSRLKLATTFSKKWREDVKTWIKDYEIRSFDNIDHEDLYNKLQIPYIFSTIESSLPSMFEKMPELIMTHRGKQDRDFTEWVASVWSYLVDKCGLTEKVEEAGLMFLITGLMAGKTGWRVETESVEDQQTVPIQDAMGNVVGEEVVTNKQEVPVVDLPTLEVPKYDRIYFSPESEFVADDDANKIPYIICETTMDPEEIKEKYGVNVDTSTYLKVEELTNEDMAKDPDIVASDIKRVSVYDYYGVLPKKQSEDSDWRSTNVYHLVFCTQKVLKKPEKINKKPVALQRNYGHQAKFFPWGEPKVLRELEQDLSLGRSSMADYRDRVTTKVAIPQQAEFDEVAFKAPRKFAYVRTFSEAIPQYITPPPIPQAIPDSINQDRQDIQMASAQLDISRGGDSSTVQTATGQQIFQQAVEKRINRKRTKIGRFIKTVAKQMLTLCAYNWDIDQFAKITDATPEQFQLLEVYIEQLKRLGDDYDIDIEVESITVNKATKSAQAIALYDKMAGNPMINQPAVIQFVLETGFEIKDWERFYLDPNNPENQQQLMTQQMMMSGGVPPVGPGGSEPTIPTDATRTNSRQFQTESGTERIPQ